MIDYRLSKQELNELRAAHRHALNVREAYRINAVILLGRGRTPADVADALLIDSDTARTYFKRYKKGGVDELLLLTLARGEWSISGFRAADLRAHIDGLSPGRSSYILKRLRTHGLIKKVAHTYKYYLTKLGRRVLVTALVIREYFVQPTLVRNAL